VEDDPDRWNINSLCDANRIQSSVRTSLSQVEGWAFVSWALYGTSIAKVNDPVALAISKLKENPNLGAGGVYDYLAQLPATELADLIYDVLSSEGYSAPPRHWQRAMMGITSLGDDYLRRVRRLYDILDIASMPYPDDGDSNDETDEEKVESEPEYAG